MNVLDPSVVAECISTQCKGNFTGDCFRDRKHKHCKYCGEKLVFSVDTRIKSAVKMDKLMKYFNELNA